MDLDLTMVVTAALAVTMAGAFAVRYFALTRRDRVRTRLEQIGREGEPVEHAAASLVRAEGWGRVLGRFAKLKGGGEGDEGRLREQLAWAGYRGAHATESYVAIKLATTLGLGLAALGVDALHPMPSSRLAAMVIVGALLGFVAPTLWLKARIDARQKAIRHALADALDLLVSCVEAGLALEGALERVAQEVELSSPILAEELMQTVHEINAGLGRSDCFRRLAARTGVVELRSLAAILVQTELFGTSVGRALRVLSESLRVQRMQRAQERAGSVAVRLTIPLIICLLPSLMTVIMGGAVVRVVRYLLPTLRAGGHG